MNRPKDTFLIMLLPQTLTAAIALTMFAVIAFRMEANTEGFVFSFFSLFAWIALVSESSSCMTPSPTNGFPKTALS